MPRRKRCSPSNPPLTTFVGFTLKMEVASSSETFVTVREVTPCRNPEDHSANLVKARPETTN